MYTKITDENTKNSEKINN